MRICVFYFLVGVVVFDENEKVEKMQAFWEKKEGKTLVGHRKSCFVFERDIISLYFSCV